MATYEELLGARGREIFYRADRYKAAELFRRGSPALHLDAHSYTLRDLSISGLGAVAAEGTNTLPGAGRCISVQLGIRGVPIFAGQGEVVRAEPTARGTEIGVRLLDRCLDIPGVVASYQKAMTAAELDEWANAEAAVPPEYRQLCADVLHLLRRGRTSLERFEATAPGDAAAADLLAACEERVLPRWRALWRHGNELVQSIAGDQFAWQATKRYTEAVLTPDFILGAFARRCYEKPLGYPGDYEAMNMAYDRRREGRRLADQLVHRVGLDVGECIANRMIIMRQAIAHAVSGAGEGPVRVASLGCGPAREVVDFLKVGALPRPVELTLIDQDHAALSHAYERALPEVMRHRGRASVVCLRSSFVQLLKAGELFGKLPPQHLIYSVGLIDYLTARRAKSLVEALYDHLAPGGRLVVGNMKAGPNSTLWPVDFITDWPLAYRSDRDMLDLAAEIPGASLDVTEDATGRVCMLSVRKPVG